MGKGQLWDKQCAYVYHVPPRTIPASIVINHYVLPGIHKRFPVHYIRHRLFSECITYMHHYVGATRKVSHS